MTQRESWRKNRALASGSQITNRSSISANRIQMEELLNPLGLSFDKDPMDKAEDIKEEEGVEDDEGKSRTHPGQTKLNESQIRRLRGLQNPYSIFDNQGNLLESQYDAEEILKKEKYSYFILKRWRMPLRKYIQILMVLLVMALFFERFFFAVIVYKTKNYGYALILFVLFFNMIFLWLIQRLRQNKQRKRLFQIFS